jgi:cation transport protein ChaC
MGSGAADPGAEDVDLWVFAYGSLIWNPGFAYKSREAATLVGYHRRYCIQSMIYRGTPQKPGLVLGLVAGGCCEGVAYRVAGELSAITLDYLRERELVTSVYHETIVAIETRDRARPRAYTYVADEQHEQYVPERDFDALVDIIEGAAGEAGPNYEYAINTWAKLAELGVSDPEVERVAEALMRRAGRG